MAEVMLAVSCDDWCNTVTFRSFAGKSGHQEIMKKKKTKKSAAENCPCGSGLVLADCCGRYFSGGVAPDAASLMRSRYSAYALGLEAYLLATWHASTRPPSLDLTSDVALKWIGLDVVRIAAGEVKSEVEFIARYKLQGRAGRMHELSNFIHENGQWFYLDGAVIDE